MPSKDPLLAKQIIFPVSGGQDIMQLSDGTTVIDSTGSVSGTTVQYNDIANPDGNGTIAFAGYTNTWTSTLDTGSMFTISDTDASLAGATNLVDLKFTDDGSANGIFLRCLDNSGADAKFTIGAEGLATIVGGIDIPTDATNITLGASGATDAYIQFDGTDLVFFDSNLGTAVTLSTLADQVIAGDLTISNGQFAWTDTADEVAGTWAFAGEANNDINWTSSCTTGNCLTITADDLTSGDMILLDSVVAGLTSGNYIHCYDGAASDFTVAKYGAVTIAGVAATDVLTITAGDLQISAGDIDLDDGIIAVDNDADEGNNITRTFAGAGTAAVLTASSAHASGTNNALFVNQDGTGAATAMLIDSEGTGDCLTIQGLSAAASLIKATGEAATGTILESISAASATVSAATFTDTGTAGTGWLGADGVGQVQITCDGNLAHANASCMLIEYSGTGAATGLGTSLRIVDTGATATSTAVYISAATGEALRIDSGTVIFDETLTVTGLLTATAGTTGKIIHAGITTSTGAAAVAVTGGIHEITTDGAGNAMTLVNGTAGQKLTVIYVAEGGGADTAVLTPTTLAGGATITFNALGDSADLTYSATGGWYMTGGTAAIA